VPFLLIPVFAAIGFTGTVTIGGTAIATAAIAANVAFSAIALGAQFALQSASARQAKKASRKNAQAQTGVAAQQTVRYSVEPRKRYYGRVKVGGALAFVETRDGNFYSVTCFNNGTVDAFEEFYIANRTVLVDAFGAVTTPPYWIRTDPIARLSSYGQIQAFRGFKEQAISTAIQETFSEWDNAHKLNGVAYAAMVVREWKSARFNDIIGGQPPTLLAQLRASRVFDPRVPMQVETDAETWQWSDNPALCVRDYLRTHMVIAAAAVDVASFAVAADICDEAAQRKGQAPEKRYTLNGGYAYDESPRECIDRMLDTCRGELFINSEGLIALRVAEWIDPTVTIGEDDIVKLSSLKRRQGLLYDFNAVKVKFTSPAHNYQEVQAATVSDESAVLELGREIVDDTSLPFVTSHTQAQRLAKIELYEDNPEWVGEITCHLTALALIGERVFRFVDSALDLDFTARITKLVIASDLSNVTVAFESINPSAYEWDAETEEGPAPALPPSTSEDATTPSPPTALSALVETVGGQPQAAIRWSAPERAGQVYDLRYREIGAAVWQQESGVSAQFFLSPALTPSANYEYEVRTRTSVGGISSWAQSTFTATAFSATSLAAPTALSASGGPEFVAATATQSVTSEAWFLQFLATPTGLTPNWAEATSLLAIPSATEESPRISKPEGVYDIRARSSSAFGTVVSTSTGPVTVTVTDVPAGSGEVSGPGGGGGDSSGTGSGTGSASGASGGDPGGVGSGSATGGLY
jgi:hypothetical protein